MAVTTCVVTDRLEVLNVAVAVPQPEVHIRADKRVKYEYVGRVLILQADARPDAGN